MFVEPASAASVAGLLQVAAAGGSTPGQRVVCTVTGHGLKDPDWAISGAPAPVTIPVDAAAAAAAAGPGPEWATPAPAVRVRVPATSANLGPGFDALGLALACTTTSRRASPTAAWVEVSGEGAGSCPPTSAPGGPGDAGGFAELGWTAARAGLAPRNRIPHGRGLGSSAAAIVAGVLCAARCAPTSPAVDDATPCSGCRRRSRATPTTSRLPVRRADPRLDAADGGPAPCG